MRFRRNSCPQDNSCADRHNSWRSQFMCVSTIHLSANACGFCVCHLIRLRSRFGTFPMKGEGF